MKVLLINGSPHPSGTTAAALAEVAGAIQKNGIQTETLQLGTKPVRGCIACKKCRQLGKCVFEDDPVNEWIVKAQEADGLVIGSPVYYASPNGALLAALDRMFYAAGPTLAFKPGAAIVCARRAGTTASLDALNKYFLISQMPVVASWYWNMAFGNNAQEVTQDAEGLAIMRGVGENMAWVLKSIEAGREKGVQQPQRDKVVRTNFIR